MGNGFSCNICLTRRRWWQRFDNKRRCKHSFCKECIEKYIISKVDDRAPYIECPEFGCHVLLDPSSCKHLLSEPMYTRWRNLIHQFNTEIANANASGTRDDVDLTLALLVLGRKLQQCPCCKHGVERVGGCSIVRCRCGTVFCHRCGGRTSLHFRCTRKEMILFGK